MFVLSPAVFLTMREWRASVGLTSEPEGEMGTPRRAGEEGRTRSRSKGSSRRGFFFFSVSRSLISPGLCPWPSDRVSTPDRKSAISSCPSAQEVEERGEERERERWFMTWNFRKRDPAR